MKRACWMLGHALDVLHLPLAGAVLLFGRLWLPSWLHLSLIFATVILQLWLKTCPLNPIVIWLKRKYEPDYKHSSIVERLYDRFGKMAALLILSLLIGGSFVIARLVGAI